VFTTEPVLAIPDIDKEMRVEADASDYATGGVLSTKCEDGKWRPVAFISKSLNATEHNYEIHNKEMLAVCHKLHSAISPPILHRFSRSQWLRKALEKTF